MIKWICRTSSYEGLACEWSLALAFESALKIKIPVRAEYIRALLAELQRILWGFHYLSMTFRSLGDEPRVQQALRLREFLFQSLEIFTGSRILPQVIVVGGVERDLSVGDIRKFREVLKNIEFEMRLFFRDLSDEALFLRRLKGVLPLSSESLSAVGWEGPVLQASGQDVDRRSRTPYGVYQELAVKRFVPGNEGNSSEDALARFQAVLFQIRQSVNLCYHLIVSFPEGEHRMKIEGLDPKQVKSRGTVEGATGSIHSIIENGEVKILTNSIRVRPHLEKLLVGLHWDDFDLALASLGFSFEEADVQ
jgi:Ni,Fe-hydrogenase III large subunit